MNVSIWLRDKSFNYTVGRTLLNSTTTNACRQPDSAHKRKIPLAFVLFTQSKFSFTLYICRAEKCFQQDSISQLLYLYSDVLPTLPLLFISIRAGNSLIDFLSELLVFCEKISKWAIRLKKRAFRSLAHFWWATWVFRSWSITKNEGMSNC